MQKISSTELVELIGASSATLRKQASIIASQAKQIADYQNHQRAEKLASKMHSKGIDTDIPVDRLADSLSKMASQQGSEFEQYEKAVEMVGPDMGTKQAQLRNEEDRNGLGGSDLERCLVGEIG